MLQRAFSIALSVAAVALSAVLAFPSARGPELSSRSAGSSARLTEPHPTARQSEAGVSLDAGSPSADSPLPSLDLAASDLRAGAGKGAPRHVRFGVVLVTYDGAEGAPAKGARRKSEALALATRLADEGKTDFHATVARGDSGSADDVGEVKRGDLEPEPEAVLFALPVGGVSGVIDTPRGFWIVKRVE